MKKIFEKVFGNVISTVISLYFMASFLILSLLHITIGTIGADTWVLWSGFCLVRLLQQQRRLHGPISSFFSSSGSFVFHVSKAIDYANKATAIINKGGAYEIVSQSDIDAIIGYYKKALQEAEQADIESMNRHYQGFGDHFKDRFHSRP